MVLACQETPAPNIRLGKEYDAQRQLVVDTTSEFHLNDLFHLRLSNEAPFGVDSLDMVVYVGADTSAVLSKRRVPVDSRSGVLVIRGTERKPLTARNFLKTTTPSFYTIVFYDQGRSLASKTLRLFSGKE